MDVSTFFLVPSAECICEVFDLYFYSVTDA